MASSIGMLVLAVLWLVCAVASLRVAARLAAQHEQRVRHAHGDVHAWPQHHPGAHERPPVPLLRTARRWAVAARRRAARLRHRLIGR
ncbi:hypothetical protein AB0H83_21550 [Dactylosporangium sp. NPDC050688]|uniref:hypothetical protein n=1 Tax=Dactylosporangium sp. NPDC050688 TaxID=3157217 RepID=UPI0033F7EB5D